MLASLSVASAQMDINFADGSKYPGPEIAGSDGWVINNPLPGLSFLASVSGAGNWGALGGVYDVPVTTSEVILTHPVGAPAKTSDLYTKFFIRESTPAYPGRDAFGFRFGGGANGLFEIKFVPNDTDPLQPGLMDIFVGANGSAPAPTGSAIFDDATYVLAVDFNESGSGDLEMFATIGGGLNTYVFDGLLTGGGNATWDDFSIVWYSNGLTSGDNYIATQFLGVIPVPEPGSAMASLLTGMMGLSVIMRRRRRA